MEGKGGFEGYSGVGHAWNREGSLKKSLEGGKEQKVAQQEGHYSLCCSGNQEEGRPRKRMEDDNGQK